MTITITQTVYEPIPTGKYPAKIAEITETDGQYGPQLRISFELPPDEKGETKKLIGWTSRKFSPKSKLFEWTQAAFGGAPIDRGYNFSSDDLIGRKVMLVVIEKQNDEGVFNKIESVLPLPTKPKATRSPEPPPQPELNDAPEPPPQPELHDDTGIQPFEDFPEDYDPVW